MSSFKAYISYDEASGSFWQGSSDKLRKKLKAYWVSNTNADSDRPVQKFEDAGTDVELKDRASNEGMTFSEYTFAESLGTTFNNLYKTTETFRLEPNGTGDMTNSDFVKFVTKFADKTFTDCTFFTTVPSTDISAERVAAGPLELLESDFKYSALKPNFESYVSDKIPPIAASDQIERYIPNLYGYYIAHTVESKNIEKMRDRLFCGKGYCKVHDIR